MMIQVIIPIRECIFYLNTYCQMCDSLIVSLTIRGIYRIYE